MINLIPLPLVYTLFTASVSGGIGLILKSCHDSTQYQELNKKYTQSLEDLNNCRSQRAIIENSLQQQSLELSRYSKSQERYKQESILKYEAKHEKTQQPCTFDFTFANDLLMSQGAKRLQ